MFSNLATKVALKKVGLPSDTFDFSSWKKASSEGKPSKKITKSQPPTTGTSNNNDANAKAWPEWMSIKSLPLTVQPWLTPRPPPIPIADPPRVGDLAPLDRDRKLVLGGGGKKVIVVFLRCVGCAFAQKTFLHLRALATKYPSTLTCIAVSHSSPAATQKWIDLLGGGTRAGGGLVQVVVDEDRAVYAAWGLGLGSVWYVLNPASQVAGFKEKGWLGERVAGSLGATSSSSSSSSSPPSRVKAGGSKKGGVGVVAGEEEGGVVGPATTMGNKWQQAGAWAVDGRGTVVWGGKAAKVDDVMDLDAGVRALGIA
ncbi:hypothetical protein C8A00DRAFT_40799 [Chaetomidium leptoderma]|uniref:Alkyl hydroperoxide reductase subunit C/ Thiol specific antioxidant domain-containing protein n=1 Tax=Chaetomidium leptoderma TaxID=669021 RepID=A0AAN6ZYJ9_9PEZI|nr:hypothetical protein C8A00DRAFT_40799 [Chaetomidium leptoderma]